MKKIFIAMLIITLGACGNRVGQLNSIERAEEMQKDLETRRLFYNALEGTFEGTFYTGDSESSIRIVLTQTLPDYDIDRVKTLQELEYEFQNLAFHVQITSWSSPKAAFGCTFENIKPDIKNGVIKVVSAECPNSYQLYVKDIERSIRTSENIVSGRENDILSLEGIVYSRNLSKRMRTFVEKVSP